MRIVHAQSVEGLRDGTGSHLREGMAQEVT